MLKHTVEGNHLAPCLINAIIENLVVRVESGSDIVERMVVHRILHPYLENIKAIIHLEVLAHVFHVKRIKLGLRLAQGFF